MTDRTLDRLVHFDKKSRNYPVTAVLDTTKPRSYTWYSYSRTDQGREGACVGHAVAGELAAIPKVVRGIDDAYALELYREAQRVDEWPGEGYSGSSVLAGVQVAQTRGHYLEYRWAFDPDELAVAVSRLGPAVLGINWLDGMYRTVDIGGEAWINAAGRVVGGHAILCVGYSLRRRAFRLQNSWGSDWGDNGRAWIDHDDLAALLADQGEACIPVRR